MKTTDMKTTEEIMYPDDATFYSTCEYKLSKKDKAHIKKGQTLIKKYSDIFSINYMYYGDVKLYSEDEECRIDWLQLTVYDDCVYLKMTEKYSDVKYEILIEEDDN